MNSFLFIYIFFFSSANADHPLNSLSKVQFTPSQTNPLNLALQVLFSLQLQFASTVFFLIGKMSLATEELGSSPLLYPVLLNLHSLPSLSLNPTPSLPPTLSPTHFFSKTSKLFFFSHPEVRRRRRMVTIIISERWSVQAEKHRRRRRRVIRLAAAAITNCTDICRKSSNAIAKKMTIARI